MNNKIIIPFSIALLLFISLRLQAQDGSLDPSFDTDGIVTTDFWGYDGARSSAIQSDGKIVVVGSSYNGLNNDFSVVRYNTDGSLDTTFSVDGKVMTAIGSSEDDAFSVVIQSDGKIVVAGISLIGGYNPYIAVVRYNDNGSLDNTFDTDGIIMTPLLGTPVNNAMNRSLALQSDGKILVTGLINNNNTVTDFAVARYNTNGSIDNTFDNDGIATNDFTNNHDYANGIAVKSSGQIVLVGSSYDSSYNMKVAIAQYDTLGGLDPSFDTDGKLILDVGILDGVFSVVIQNDGKIVVAGFNRFNNGVDTITFVVVRCNTDGTLDNTFDTDGIFTTSEVLESNTPYSSSLALQSDGKIVFTSNITIRFNTDGSLDNTFDTDGKIKSGGYSMALQSDDKIVIVGTTSIDFLATRHNTDGSIDSTFGNDGEIVTNIGNPHCINYSVDLALQSDGKMVVAGSSRNNSPGYASSQEGFAIARYNIDGSLDNSFGADGRVFTNIYDKNAIGRSVAIQNDGKIIVAGQTSIYSFDFNMYFQYYIVFRYNADGSLDNTFDGDGRIVANFAGFGGINSVVLQSDGKILLAGVQNGDFLLARYNTNGSLDNTFGTNGSVFTSAGDIAFDIVLQSDGKILVAGASYNGSNNDFAIARYNTNGSLDNTFDVDGKVITAVGSGEDIAYSIALQSDGKILVAGESHNGSDIDFAIVRYNTDGSLDNSFDGDGKVFTAIGFVGDIGRSMTLQSDGKILVAGQSYNGSNDDIAVIRYNTDGSLDNSFGTNGIVTNDVNGNDIAYAIALQSDDKIVIAGRSNNDFVVVRYNNTTIAIEKIASEEWILNTYPNPAKESVTVEIDNRLLGSKYLIVNQLGQIMFTGKFVSEKTNIDVQDLAQGVYFLQIAGKAEGVVKIVKE